MSDDDIMGVDGRILDRFCRSGPHWVSDEILQWHFKQCVLANV